MVFYSHDLFSGNAQWKYENMSSLNSLLVSFYSPHYIEKHGNGEQGKIERRKRQDPGNEGVRKWQTQMK